MDLMCNKFSGAKVYLLLLLLLFANGMAQKKLLSEKDFSLWSTLSSSAISENGNWVTYRLKYEYSMDTLFLRSNTATKPSVFVSAKNESFNGEKHFACLQKDTLLLLNLKTMSCRRINNVLEYGFSANGNTC